MSEGRANDVRPSLPLSSSMVWNTPLPTRERPLLHLLLFLLTLFSMTAAGAMQLGVDPLAQLPYSLVHMVEGVPFAAALLGILTVHEFGHYFAARRWGVKATLPFFLPFPYLNLFGTMGAVIRIRSTIPHKRALLDIGASGPLAGFVVAVGVCAWGLSQSVVVGPEYFISLADYQWLKQRPMFLGGPLIFSGLMALFGPESGSDQVIMLSPLAFAGWAGLLITMLNLLPIGQLDGGHINYTLFNNYKLISRITLALLLLMGVYGILSWWQDWPTGWPGWIFLAFIFYLLGKTHPTPYDPTIQLDKNRRRIGYFCIFIFVICFTPVPFHI